jgi:hypothetical protein
MNEQHLEAEYDAIKEASVKNLFKEEDLGVDISEEAADKLEVECGHCGKLIRIRSLADHILVAHSTSIEKSRCTF